MRELAERSYFRIVIEKIPLGGKPDVAIRTF
jgi:hypothetical protein